jgi:hypothetical protein
MRQNDQHRYSEKGFTNANAQMHVQSPSSRIVRSFDNLQADGAGEVKPTVKPSDVRKVQHGL